MQLPSRLESIVLKSNLHLGVLSEVDRELILAMASCAIAPGRSLREYEVNQLLGDWLDDIGQMLRTDHVELRRWLVHARYMARDDWGRAYVRRSEHVDQTRQVLGTADAAALQSAVLAARVAAQTARLARRRAFESRRPRVGA